MCLQLKKLYIRFTKNYVIWNASYLSGLTEITKKITLRIMRESRTITITPRLAGVDLNFKISYIK